ncbi:MAG: extensin family protein [Deltaproteobacteria bacterium]|nr:extensin family protein [Deltaproteobacteria bacterium]
MRLDLTTFLISLLALVSLPESVESKKRKKHSGPRPEMWCIRALRNAGISFRRGPRLKNVRTPVTILNGRIGRIKLMNGSKMARPRMDCRTAWALYRTGRIFSANGGIDTLIVGNFYSYRYVKNSARLSRHASGLAVDIYGVKTKNGRTYMVSSDYEHGLGKGKSCEGNPKKRGGRLLRQLACDLDDTHYFRAILTPDSDRDHQDHFHISIYKSGEKRKRRNRTVLLEPQHFGKKWVKKRSRRGYPSRKRVYRVMKSRYRKNRNFLRKKAARARKRYNPKKSRH